MGGDAVMPGLAALACPRPQRPPSHRVPRVRSCPVRRRRPRLHGSDFGQPGVNFEYFLTPFPGGAQLGSSSVTLAGALSWLPGHRVELLDAVTTGPVVETHGDRVGSPWSPAVMDSAGRKSSGPGLSVGRAHKQQKQLWAHGAQQGSRPPSAGRSAAGRTRAEFRPSTAKHRVAVSQGRRRAC